MILCFDTETTSIKPGQICQLAYTMQSGDCVKARNLFFTVDTMDYSAYKVHGFSLENLYNLSNGKRFADFFDIIEQDFNSAELVVSHNTAFDFMFMRTEFERLGKVFSPKREFCTMKKSTPICKLKRTSGVGYKYPKLSELCEFFNISVNEIEKASIKIFGEKVGFHDARFDTTALFMCLNYAINFYDEYKGIKEFL